MAIKLTDVGIKLKAEGDEAVKRAMRDVGTEAKKVGRGISDLINPATAIKAALGGIAIALSARAIGGFFASSVREAAEAESKVQELRQAVENAGGEFERLRPALDDAANGLQKISRFGDEAARGALTTMISISGDTRRSLDNLQLAADLASAKHMDLGRAAEIVGKVMIGNTKVLRQMGISVKEGDNAIEIMRARFAGFAEGEAKTFRGRLEQISNAWGDMKEAIGTAIVEGNNAADGMVRLRDVITDLTKKIEENGAEIASWINTAIDMSIVVGVTLKAAFIVLAGTIIATAHAALLAAEALHGLANPSALAFGGFDRMKSKLDDLTTTLKTIKGAAEDAANAINAVERARAARANQNREGESDSLGGILRGRGGAGDGHGTGGSTGTGKDQKIKIPKPNIHDFDFPDYGKKVQEALDKRFGIGTPNVRMPGDDKLPPEYEKALEQQKLFQKRYGDRWKEELAKLKGEVVQRANEITGALGAAIQNGFAAAFSGEGIGGAFRAFGRTILSGLGQIFVQMGEKMVAASAIMESFAKALTAFIPGGGLAAGLGLIALGSAMMGAGRSSGGGRGHGGRIGSYGRVRPAEEVTRITLGNSSAISGASITPIQPVTFNVFGPNDPQAQRAIGEALEKWNRRRAA